MLQLVKNPAGFRQTLRTARRRRAPAAIVIAINDDYADGRDVSWLWDVDFAAPGRRMPARLSTSGTRAADMAVRLRYDERRRERDRARPGEGRAAGGRRGRDRARRVVVFSTYTAMWALHAILLRIGSRER